MRNGFSQSLLMLYTNPVCRWTVDKPGAVDRSSALIGSIKECWCNIEVSKDAFVSRRVHLNPTNFKRKFPHEPTSPSPKEQGRHLTTFPKTLFSPSTIRTLKTVCRNVILLLRPTKTRAFLGSKAKASVHAWTRSSYDREKQICRPSYLPTFVI